MDLRTLLDPTALLLTIAIIAVATFGKFLGAFFGGAIGGLSPRESLALATGLNARGSTEVIIASIGLSIGALNNQLYTMIVAMAILTTMAMPPSLRWVLARVPMREEEGRRIEKRYTRKDGEHVWADLTMRLVRGADQRPMYFQTVTVDIRDRKRAEVLQAARFAVTQALVTSPGWEKAAPAVLEGLCRTLDWELAEYWEVDINREAMHFVTSWKRPGRDTAAFEGTAASAVYRRGEGLAGRVWESGAPLAMPVPNPLEAGETRTWKSRRRRRRSCRSPRPRRSSRPSPPR